MSNASLFERLKGKLVPIIGALALAVAALVFRTELTAWFTGKDVSASESDAAGGSAGGIAIESSLSPDPPKQGDNKLIVTLAGANGKPITGAEIDVQVWMPAMGQMPEMRTKGKVSEAGDGRYEAPFDIAMGGTWTVDVVATTEDGEVKAEYTLTVGSSGLNVVNIVGSGGAAAPAAKSHTFATGAFDSLRGALDAYETIRTKLAADDGAGLAAPANSLAEALTAAGAAAAGAPPELAAHFAPAAAAAKDLATAADIEAARAKFGVVSKHLVLLVTADERLSGDRHAFMCPMVKGNNRWIQTAANLDNPYQGKKMSTCGSELKWDELGGGGDTTPAHTHDPDDIAYYTCPMDTWVKQKQDGSCPVCGMDLQPVTKEQVKTGILNIDHRRRQLIGIRSGVVERRDSTRTISAIGKVTYDETRLADVTLKYRGWVNKLYVNKPGQKVHKGQTLFTVYSPELYAAQQEYLLALRQYKVKGMTESGKATADALLIGARERLRLWDVTGAQMKKIATRGKPMRYLPVTAPAGGYVVDKNILEGGAFQPGQRLYRIANLSKIWVEAEIYEKDIPEVKVGQRATITLSHVPGKEYEGTIAFVYPYLDRASRTARARIVMSNKGLDLKPDMFANVAIPIDRGEKLMVAESAVIYSGPRRIVFVDLGSDKFQPVVVEVGAKTNGYFEVISGLKEGDKIVVSGNFLLSSESRLKSATGLW